MKWQKLDLQNPPEGEVLAAWDNYFGVAIGLVKFTLKNGALMFHDDEAEYWREAECVMCYFSICQPIPDLRDKKEEFKTWHITYRRLFGMPEHETQERPIDWTPSPFMKRMTYSGEVVYKLSDEHEGCAYYVECIQSKADRIEIYKDQLKCEKEFLNATIRSIDARAEVGHVIFTMNNFKRKAYTQERIAQIDKTLESLGVL